IVLATDATIHPRIDSTTWRLALLAAALNVIRAEWTQSAHWPVAFAGLSGGAKRSGLLGAIMAKNGTVRICGIFLAGINFDNLSEGYRGYHPPGDFLSVPIWISSGTDDRIAPPRLEGVVYASLKRTGFERV